MIISVFFRLFAFPARTAISGPDTGEGASGSSARVPATQAPDVFASHALWVLSGTGFAFGCGWLWFVPLRELWLPEFLRGSFFTGGAGLFVLLLCLGGILARWRPRPRHGFVKRSAKGSRKVSGNLSGEPSLTPFENSSANPFAKPFVKLAGEMGRSGNSAGKFSGETDPPDFRLGLLPHCGHVLAMALASAALFGFGPAMPHVGAACLALAAVCLGVFWMAALLVLPAGRCLAAFLWACVLSSALVALRDEAAAKELLPAVFFAAWVSALALGWMLRQLRLVFELARLKTPEPKRPRGRPLQRAALAPEKPKPAPLSRMMVFSAVLVFLLTGLGRSGLRHALAGAYGQAPFPWLDVPLCAAGVALALFFHVFRGRSGARCPDTVPPAAVAICIAFAVQGMGFLFPWETLPFIVRIVEGVVYGSVFILFAAAPADVLLPAPDVQRSAGLRAATVLGCAAVFAYAGATAGEALYFFCEPYQNAGRLTAGWAGGATLVLAGLLGSMVYLGAYSHPRDADSAGNTLAALLTEREYTIAGMVSQGRSNKDIAAGLFISEDTVRFHLKRIYQKTGLRGREELRGLKADAVVMRRTGSREK